MFRQRLFPYVMILAVLITAAVPVSVRAQEPKPGEPVQPLTQEITAVFQPSDPSPDETIWISTSASSLGFNQNIIVNGNAEAGNPSPWQGGTDDFINVVSYGTSPYPTLTDPGPADRGTRLFVGSGNHHEINAWQDVDVSALAAAIDTGILQFDLSGYFGGIGSRDDRAFLRVYFNGANGQGVPGSSPVVIGGVSAAERGNLTCLLPHETSGVIPKGTRKLTFQLQNLAYSGGNPTALADNLSFVIRPLTVTLPMVLNGPEVIIQTSPAAPLNLTIQASELGKLNLGWKDNSTNEKGFKVERAPGGTTNFVILAYAPANSTSFTDINLANNTTYTYRLSAFNEAGSSSAISASGKTLAAPTTKPAAPASCWTSGTSSSSTILYWTDSSNNEESFKIVKFIPPGDYNYLNPIIVAANSTSATIEGLPPNWTVHFRIAASNSAGDSSYCETSAKTAPADVSAFGVRNDASYPIVYLMIDGIQYFPVYPMGILPGGYYAIDLDAGIHTYEIRTGFWESQTQRFYMYTYTGSFDLPATGVWELKVPDITLAELLTQFSSTGYGYWEGYYFDSNANCRTAAFRFKHDNTYQFFVSNQPQGTGTYSLTQRLPDIFSVKFAVSGVPGTDALLVETHGEFYLKNGPPSWQQITYVYKPQGYVYNQFCP